jgi:galactose mutarotase-like enzyme
MYYSFGAHPAFNCQIGDYLEFNKDTSLETERIDHESILIDEKFPVEMNENRITVTKDLFVDDALILSSFNSDSISIKSNSHDRVIRFDFDSPFLGIWAKPNAPYVCLEPWWGVNDSYHKVSDFSEKRGIMALEANEYKTFTWEVSISE